MEKLASILEPLVKSNPGMRVVLHPCAPDGPYIDVETTETAHADPDTLDDIAGGTLVLVIN